MLWRHDAAIGRESGVFRKRARGRYADFRPDSEEEEVVELVDEEEEDGGNAVPEHVSTYLCPPA